MIGRSGTINGQRFRGGIHRVGPGEYGEHVCVQEGEKEMSSLPLALGLPATASANETTISPMLLGFSGTLDTDLGTPQPIFFPPWEDPFLVLNCQLLNGSLQHSFFGCRGLPVNMLPPRGSMLWFKS